jgi:tRNA A37 methylthiotransferase MiaB
MQELRSLAARYSHAFRASFIGQNAEILTERNHRDGCATTRHGRSERYFDVQFCAPSARPGDLITVRVDRVTPTETFGVVEHVGEPPA